MYFSIENARSTIADVDFKSAVLITLLIVDNMYSILVKELEDEAWMMWREPVNMKHETRNMKSYKDVYSIQWTGSR